MRSFVLTFLIALTACAQSPPAVRWMRYYDDGREGDRELAYGMCADQHGGPIMVGTLEIGSSISGLIVEVDGNGDTLATRRCGSEWGIAVARSVIPKNGGYFIGGACFGGAWVFGVDTNLDTLWSRCYAVPSGSWWPNMVEAHGGGVLLMGVISPPESIQVGGDVGLLRVGGDGDSLWFADVNNAVIENFLDGVRVGDGYGFAGYMTISTGEDGACLVRTDSVGNTLWFHIYSPPESDTTWANAKANAVEVCSDGGFILVGDNYGWTYRYQGYVVRTDSVGDSLWTRVIGDSIHQYRLWDVIQTADGGFVAVGDVYDVADIWLIKLDSLGNTVWSGTYGDPIESENAVAIMQAEDGGFLIGGSGIDPAQPNSYDFLLIRTEPEGQTAPEPPPATPASIALSSYPNPFNATTTLTFMLPVSSHVEIALYDVLGRKVKTLLNENRMAGESRIMVDGSDLPSGIYVARMQVGDVVKAHKLLLLK